MPEETSRARRIRTAHLLALSLVSSACDLALEIAWGRALGLVLGVTVFAVSVVLAAFMLGLTLGSFGARRLARGSSSPVTLYARLHAGIGVSAAATLLAIPAVRTLYVAASHATASVWALRPLLFLLAFLVLFVPTTLIGATFPIASRILAPSADRAGREIGLLYSVGVLGSLLGCVVTVVVLLPAAGLHGTILFAAGLELAVAAWATMLTARSAEATSAASMKIPLRAIALAACLGAQTLAYEVLWTRVLTYFVDTSIYSFALMLAVFLSGLAAGSAVASRHLDARRDPGLIWREPLRLFGGVQVALGLTAIFALFAFSQLSDLVASLDGYAKTSWGLEAAGRFALFSVALIAPTMLLGAAFPLVVQLGAGNGASLARAVERIYGANTAGGVAGSLAAGFLLVPWLGVERSVLSVASFGVVLGCVCFRLSELEARKQRTWIGASLALLAGLVAATPRDALTAIYTGRYAPPANELLYLRENENGTTAVFRDARQGGPNERRYLVIDGRGEVSTDYFSMRAFRFLGVVPSLYAARPENALVVTFGSGIVAGTIAGLSDVKHADCVEICADAFGAARFFASENHDVADDPKVTFLVNDGRSYLLTSEKRYDILSADATHPASRDSWILYTKEFYDLCAAHLNDGGVMSQWVPMHGVSESDFKSLLKTFHSAFPFVAVYYAGGFKAAGHVVLLGSKSPLRIDVHHAERLFENERIREDLARVNVKSLPDLFGGFLFDESAVEGLVGDAPLNTDDKPVVAFSLPEAGRAPRSWLASIAKPRAQVYPELAGMEPEMAAGVERGLGAAFVATGLALQAQVLEAKEYEERGALDLEHPDEEARRGLERSEAALHEVIGLYEQALQVNPGDTQAIYLRTKAASELRSLRAMRVEDVGQRPR